MKQICPFSRLSLSLALEIGPTDHLVPFTEQRAEGGILVFFFTFLYLLYYTICNFSISS